MYACTLPRQISPESLAFWAWPRLKKSMALSPVTPVETAAPVSIPHEKLLVQVGTRQDRAAFATLFDYYAPRIKSYLLKNGANDSAAEEIVQNAFVTVWEKASQFDPKKAAASTWIFTIARNKRIDTLRREKFVEVNSDDPAFLNASYTPEDDYADAATLDRLNAAIAALPADQARLLQMAFFEDKSHQTIAQETAIPLGTVKSRLRLAIDKLRHSLKIGKGAAE